MEKWFIFYSLIFFISTRAGDVYFQCINVPNFSTPICINITQESCYILRTEVTYDDVYLLGPSTYPVIEVLQNVEYNQNSISQNCFDFQLPMISTCFLCTNFSEVSIVSPNNVLRGCGTASVQCFSQELARIPFCVELENCTLLNCGGNDCSHGQGQCMSSGICKCKENKGGLDCSIEQKNKCISGTALANGAVCMDADVDCDNNLQVSVSVGEKKVSPIKQNIKNLHFVPLAECQNSYNTDCFVCPYAEFKIEDNFRVKACPSITYKCRDVVETYYNFSCFPLTTLANKCSVVVPQGNNETMTDITNPGLRIFIVIFVILILSALGIASYRGRHYIKERFIDRQPTFMSAFGDIISEIGNNSDSELSDLVGLSDDDRLSDEDELSM